MGNDPSFEFNTPRGRVLFQVRNQQVMWAGMQLHLGFEPQMVGDEPCLHQLDLEKNLHPLLLTAPWSAWAGGTVVLDPGHGGVQSGTRSVLDGSVEKIYTLDWALRLKSLLEQNGWKVLLTRTNDSELSLSNRVTFANNANADLFLSLHFNAAGGGTHQAGLETYCLTPTGMPSTLTRGYVDDPAEVLPNNAFDDENVRLAAALHRSILGVNGGLDRGLRRARFMTVLRGTECPAVLIEGGFLSNPDEAARIADPMFLQKLAEVVARVLTPPMQPAGS
jgi:N-acetylmuramoyl-L-alanine amidase